MCALDRSSDDSSSQSLKETLFHIKSIYHTSPVAVCVRSEQHETLYSNKSFQLIYDFIQSESDKTLFNAGTIKFKDVFVQFEQDCISLGKGCVLCKSFPCGNYFFQVRLEYMNTPDGLTCVLWQINLSIQLPLSNKIVASESQSENDIYFETIFSTLPRQSIEALSFFILGFSYTASALHLNLPVSTVRKRIERAKEIIKGSFSTYENFINYVYKTKRIFFFVDYVSEKISVKKM
ncbi:hypothetical protein [uncultured Cedecea sp.]|uniref:hypothetical protein n=1 Tax=uncultured Cedecea sp. TaxID=988762 RepID=UPI002627EB7E|nr:hypothetical protein [uncultured Cedecea sp.]